VSPARVAGACDEVPSDPGPDRPPAPAIRDVDELPVTAVSGARAGTVLSPGTVPTVAPSTAVTGATARWTTWLTVAPTPWLAPGPVPWAAPGPAAAFAPPAADAPVAGDLVAGTPVAGAPVAGAPVAGAPVAVAGRPVRVTFRQAALAMPSRAPASVQMSPGIPVGVAWAPPRLAARAAPPPPPLEASATPDRPPAVAARPAVSVSTAVFAVHDAHGRMGTPWETDARVSDAPGDGEPSVEHRA
jgi:hypothetical protein